jgi:hypothetical protein
MGVVLANQEEAGVSWLPLILTLGYVLLGFVLFGNWDGYGWLGKTIYFLIFPFHFVAIGIFLSLYRGVNRYLAIWKMALTTLFVLALLYCCLLMMAQK